MAIGMILGGLSIASTVLGYSSQKKSRRRQKRAESLSAKRSTIANVYSRRAQMAAVRRQQAVRQVAAVASGQAGGSSDGATRSSIASQGLAARAYQRQQEDLGDLTNSTIASANAASNQAQTYGAVAGLLGQATGFVDQMALNNISPPTPSLPTAPTINPHTR